MMFFDCNKVGIHLDLQTTQFIPGDMIRGIFHLNVMRDLEITALRVCVKGKEKAWRWEEDRPQGGPQQGGGPRESNYRLYEERFVHFMRIITVFGQSRQSGAKGRVYLRPGQYQYPFEVELPPNAPPSYLFSSRQVGSRIYYTIKAYVDIPFGFDAKQKLHLSVLPAVPIGQLMEARASPYIFPTTQSTIHGCEYCGCFYCEHEDSLIETSGALLPRVAILRCGSGVPMHAMPPPPQVTQVFLSKNAPAGIDQTTGNTVANPSGVAMRLDQNPAVITVHGTIRNCSRKDDIRSVRVELKQFQQLRVRGNSTSRVVTLAASTFTPPNSQLAPCQSMDVDVELRLDTHQIDTGMLACSHREYMRRFSRNYRGFGHSENYFPQRDICFDSSNSTVIFPTITTPFVECTTLFQISFPGTAVKDTLSRSDLVTIAAGVDPSNRVPASPFRYSNQLVMPEICYGGM